MTAPEVNATGVTFRNDLTYTEELNPYTYRNFYNGGGVGIGDFDHDGRQDIFFTGNLVSNRLYLNRGNWIFEDVTTTAGVGSPDSWSTGVAVVDVNADGWQDLYVCKAGPPAEERIAGMGGVRHNELFINQGDGTFREMAAAYGLAVSGLSVHAAFFDYDGDGDLDCYLLSNSTRATTGFDLRADLRSKPDPEGGNRLLKNLLAETGETRFTDVTAAAGIYSSAIGFGLGVTVGDVDGDGRPDLFISNDYFERDYLYLNRGDGTFEESLTEHLPEISKGSMGADLADLNNDGYPELFVTEMLPRTDRRYKTKAVFDGWNRYQLYRDQGYHQQFSRNVLQLNQGNGYYSEIGRFAGVEATDWSWGALLADFDGDGYRDIFVANGTGRDLLDQDYINFNGNPSAVRRMIHEEGKGITDLIDLIPEEPQANALFHNDGDLHFTDLAEAWGLGNPGFSNGSAYGDLDNDGDLDLVVNNVDAVAGLYRNNSERRGRMIRMIGKQAGNPDAIGARLTGFGPGGRTEYAEIHPMRGFQSTVDRRIHLSDAVERVEIRWPDGNRQYVDLPDSNVVIIRQGKPGTATDTSSARVAAAGPVFLQAPLTADGRPVRHLEDPATDFDRDPLLFLGINNEGPALAAGDVNGDGRTDLYLGGAAGQAGQLLLGRADGTYQAQAADLFAEDAASENVAAVFFDADGDGDPDLYVANGSNQFGPASAALLDHLYINQGAGRWTRSPQRLPTGARFVASGCLAVHDVDGDGDRDLFVGGRLRPGIYGVPTDSYLLLNDGAGNLTPADLPALGDLGMVTAASWANVDDDAALELVVAAEWGPLRYLHFDTSGGLVSVDSVPGTTGLWHALAVADFDGDGRQDVAAGNHGQNSRLQAGPGTPLELHVNDFDRNGKAEQVVTQYDNDGRSLPLVLRDDLVKQLPALRKRFGRYADYQGKSLEQLFGREVLQRSVVNRAEELRSVLVCNTAAGPVVHPLPAEAQLAPLYALLATDLDGDGNTDLLAAGNQSVGRPELGIYAGSFGAVLLGGGDGTFRSVSPRASGLYLSGDVRALLRLPGPTPRIVVARSGASLITLQNTTK